MNGLEIILDYLGGPNDIITGSLWEGPYEREADGDPTTEAGPVQQEQEVSRKGSGAFQDTGSLQIPEETRKEFSPRVSRRDQPCQHRPEPCETGLGILASRTVRK